jgi:serine/threonine protein kinase
MDVDAVLNTSTVGKYQLIASLGQGGMANVYLALVAGPAGFNKLLVVKSVREDIVNNIEGGVEMFLDEARLTARLVHPNIVTTYEVGENAGVYFLAMEYLEGQTYRAICNRGRPDKLPVDDELRILSETARGLHYVHELDDYDGTPLRVVHRDVSPQNIFITYDGLVKLLDFGIAKTAEAEHMTQVGVIKGKIDYIAPEQLRGDAIDRRADVFALGAMLWEVLTGKRFAGGRKIPDVTKAQNRLTGGERRVRDVQPEVPDALAEIVERATALKVSDRMETAGAFADAIDSYLASAGLRPTAKSLSAAVVPLFETERARMRKTIEEQIQISKQRGNTKSGATLPAVRSNYLDSTSGVWIAPDGPGEDTEKQPRSLAPLASGRPAANTAGATDPPAKGSRGLVMAFVAVGIAAIVGGILVSRNKQPTNSIAAPVATAPVAATSPAATATLPDAPSLPSAPSAPTAPIGEAAVVRLNLTVSPESARVSLDGAPLATPFSGEFRQDRTLHHLEVTAEGYRSVKQLIALERDSNMQVTLEKVTAPQRRSRVEVHAAPPPRPVVEPVATTPAPQPPPPPKELFAPKLQKPSRTIDSDDPYANH